MWTEETTKLVKKYSDRKIVVHNKLSKKPLNLLLNDAWAFVSLKSTAGFMALTNGVPTYFTDKTLSHIGKIQNIENPIIDYKIFNNLAIAYQQTDQNELAESTYIRYQKLANKQINSEK